MKTDTSFVRADSAVHLYAETTVDLYFSLVVHPRHAEHDHTLRLYHAFQHFLLTQIRVSHDNGSYALNYLADGLMKLILARIFSDEVRHKSVHIRLGLFVHNTMYDL